MIDYVLAMLLTVGWLICFGCWRLTIVILVTGFFFYYQGQGAESAESLKDNAPQRALVKRDGVKVILASSLRRVATILDGAEEYSGVSSASNLMSIRELPQEILYRIFSFLDYDALKSAILCCEAWCELGSSPMLWRYIKISPIQAENLEQVLSIRRLSQIKKINISGSIENEHMEILKNRPSLTILDINYVQLVKVEPTLAAEVLSSIESVNANEADFSGKNEQFRNIIYKEMKLLQRTNFSNYLKLSARTDHTRGSRH